MKSNFLGNQLVMECPQILRRAIIGSPTVIGTDGPPTAPAPDPPVPIGFPAPHLQVDPLDLQIPTRALATEERNDVEKKNFTFQKKFDSNKKKC